MASGSSPGSVATTSRKTLGLAALFGGLTGWLVVVVANAVGLLPPQVPWTAAVALAVGAAAVGVLAWTTHQRIQVRRERVDPQRAVGHLVLGKASAVAGAFVAAGYAVFALMFVLRLDAEAPRERVLHSAVAVVAAIGLMVAGLLLERACRVPGADSDDDPRRESDATR